MTKNKLLLLLALLLTAATGAWATDVYVVGNGTGNWLNGAIWDTGAAGNKMTEQNGVYSITFTNVDANPESSFQFKFAINGTWDVNYGCISENANELNKTLSNIDATGGYNFTFGLTEKADVTISFNLSEMTYMISTKGMKVGDDASSAPKHLIKAKYRERTRLLEQPLPYATTIGELFEAVTGEHFSDLISTMSSMEMPLTGISSNNTSAVSIGELNGASTPVTVIADGEATVAINFSGYPLGILVSAISPLYVSLKDGVKDADKWTVKVGEGQAQALPIGGLKGDGSETVTLQYNGRLKVKGVKATSEAAPAAPSVPDGALSGVFSVSDGKQVYFSKGNLRYASSKWNFFDNQYDYYTSYSADAWDHFGWSTSATDYGKNTSTTNSDYSGDFVDWGATMGTGWRTLTSDEWTYLFKTRSASTVNGTENGRYAKAMVNNVRGIILFPDTYTHPDGVTAPTGVNDTGNTGWNGNSYTVEDWTKMETAGCVFLPAAGYRNGSRVNNPGSYGDYSSATPYGTDKTYGVFFGSGSLTPASDGSRFYGCSVRLVQEATSGEQAAKESATVTTAPTGAAGLTAASAVTEKLVTGGVADGGTLKYAITSTTTQPDDAAFTLTISPTVSDLKTALSMSTLAAGTYYVWYKVFADADHADSEAAYVSVVVAEAPAGKTINLSTITADVTAEYGDKLTGTLSGNKKISIADGATVTLDGVTINGVNDSQCEWAGITCKGDATIILSGTNSVKGFYENYPGIYVPSGKTLTIQGEGSLTASPYDGGTDDSYGAGIGCGYQIACGNINITGGTITATGGSMAAGIGGGHNTSCGNIDITGGTITAKGGYGAAGIGSGDASTKKASSCGNITIANTVTKVTATKGDDAPNSIGKGQASNNSTTTCGTVTIGGVVGAISTSPYTYQPGK